MSEELRRRIEARIREGGPITFAAFMDAALYDPDDGFYATPPIGPSRHFVTSPHVSPAFGDLLARQLAEAWEHLGRPRPFRVAEVGAGDGTLARGILRAVAQVPDLDVALRYVAVERSAGARRALGEVEGVEVHGSLEEMGRFTGCVIANELLDVLPFHRLRERGGRVVEVMVGADDGRLVELEAEPSAVALAALRGPLRRNEERPVSPPAVEFVSAVASVLERGYAFVFDYGFFGGEIAGPVHAYRDHEALADVLEDPGSRDVTGAVDFEATMAEAKRRGLTVWGPVPQREALLALGYRLWSAGVRARQAAAAEHGDWREANRLYSERSVASLLIDPDKLGALRLLALGTEGLPPPAAVLGDRETGC